MADLAEQNRSDTKSIRDNENQALLRETFSCVIKIVSISPRAIFQAKTRQAALNGQPVLHVYICVSLIDRKTEDSAHSAFRR